MSFYDATVPAFLQILGSLQGILGKAEAHCQTKNIQPEVLLNARLYPDMLPLSKQIQLVCDFAAKGCARLTHSEVPSVPDTEKTFEELRQRLAKTVEYVKAFKPAQFEGADAKDVTFPCQGNLTPGPAVRQGFVPNFYFHAATALDLAEMWISAAIFWCVGIQAIGRGPTVAGKRQPLRYKPPPFRLGSNGASSAH